jgi:hypothetical protein
MIEIYKKLYESLRILEDIITENNISEIYPTYSPHQFFQNMYLEIYSTYKRNPNMYNKGRLQTMWELMNELVGTARALSIKNKCETTYNKTHLGI